MTAPNEHPLDSEREPLDIYYRTREESVAEEHAQSPDPLPLIDMAPYAPTPKANKTPPKEPRDPATLSDPQRYRGVGLNTQPREKPKPNARIYPRMKPCQTDPAGNSR